MEELVRIEGTDYYEPTYSYQVSFYPPHHAATMTWPTYERAWKYLHAVMKTSPIVQRGEIIKLTTQGKGVYSKWRRKRSS